MITGPQSVRLFPVVGMSGEQCGGAVDLLAENHLRERMRQLRPRPHIEVFSNFTDVRPGQRLEVDWAHMGYALPGVPRSG